jgi:hypothetical protein
MPVLRRHLIDKLNFFHLKFVVLCCVFILQTNIAKAQAPGMLEFGGRTVKDNKPLAGAVVTVYRNGTIQQEQIKTGKNGKFRFFLVFGSDYKITFSYSNCVDMYLMVYTGQLKKEKTDIFPLYEMEVPFFELTNTTIRVDKYKEPFAKIVYDGKKAFMDDEAYMDQFTKDIVIDIDEQEKILAEKQAKEKAEKEKLELAEKTKKDAEEKAKKDAEEKLLAEEKAKQDEIDKANELARLKEQLAADETMETEAIRLQREKEAKTLMAKKNKEIKTNYENDLLRMVAENEKQEKQKVLNKYEARANTVITQMKSEADVKAKADVLRQEQSLRKKKMLENQQYKNHEVSKLIEAAAFAERSVKISNSKTTPNVNNYVKKEIPNFTVSIQEGLTKTIRTTTVKQEKKLDLYRKETYFWGGAYYYKNNIEIDELTYNKEVSFFSDYKN